MSIELITMIATATIAVAALFTSIWQGIVTRRHNRLSVQPHIDVSHTPRQDGYGLRMDNSGVGPAVIESFSVFIDGFRINSNSLSGVWPLAIKQLGIEDQYHEYFWYPRGHFMKSGTNFWVLHFPKYELASEEDQKRIEGAVKRVGIVMEYRSIYGDSFVSGRT